MIRLALALLILLPFCARERRETIFAYPDDCDRLRLEYVIAHEFSRTREDYLLSFQQRPITSFEGRSLPVFAPLRAGLARETIGPAPTDARQFAHMVYLHPDRFTATEFRVISTCLRTFRARQTESLAAFQAAGKGPHRKIPVIVETIHADYDSLFLRFHRPTSGESHQGRFLELAPDGTIALVGDPNGPERGNWSLVGQYDGRAILLGDPTLKADDLRPFVDDAGRTLLDVLDVPVKDARLTTP